MANSNKQGQHQQRADHFARPPPAIVDGVVELSFPAEHVMHVAMNRPKQYNAMNRQLETTLNALFNWFEAEPNLWVAVLGSTSRKAWCAGQDLKEMDNRSGAEHDLRVEKGRHGFGGMSTRLTKKPLIGAINGFALGGGSEMVVNLDLCVAGQSAVFGFPEVKRGITVAAGGIPRLVKIVGHTKATELLLTGRNIPAKEALALGLVNHVVPDDQVEAKALELAKEIASFSPDSVRVILQAVRLTNEIGGTTQAHELSQETAEFKELWMGENLKEGLRAFAAKRQPVWRASKL